MGDCLVDLVHKNGQAKAQWEDGLNSEELSKFGPALKEIGVDISNGLSAAETENIRATLQMAMKPEEAQSFIDVLEKKVGRTIAQPFSVQESVAIEVQKVIRLLDNVMGTESGTMLLPLDESSSTNAANAIMTAIENKSPEETAAFFRTFALMRGYEVQECFAKCPKASSIWCVQAALAREKEVQPLIEQSRADDAAAYRVSVDALKRAELLVGKLRHDGICDDYRDLSNSKEVFRIVEELASSSELAVAATNLTKNCWIGHDGKRAGVEYAFTKLEGVWWWQDDGTTAKEKWQHVVNVAGRYSDQLRIKELEQRLSKR